MKLSLALVFSLASGLVLSAAAQTSAPAAAAPVTPVTAKVAVIAFQAAVAQTNEFQRNYADLQKKFEPKRQQLTTLQNEIDTLTKQLDSPTVSQAEKASKAAAIDTKKKQLQRDAEDAQNDFQQEMQEMFKGVAAKVYDVMSSYAQQRGYTMVLDASQQDTPVLFAVDEVNITKQILDAYNTKSGVPAPPAQPAAAAPKPAAGATHPAAAPAKPTTTH